MQTSLGESQVEGRAANALDRAFSAIRKSRAAHGEGIASIDTAEVRALLLRHPDLIEQMLSARSAVGRKLRDHNSTASANPGAYIAWAAAQQEAKARGAACDDRFEVEVDCAHAGVKPWTLDDLLSDRDIADDLQAQATRLELLLGSYKERLEEARYYADQYGDVDGRRAEHIKDLQRKIRRCRDHLKDLRYRIERLDCVQVLTLLRALALVVIEQELEDVKDPKFRDKAVAWLASPSERPISFRWWARLAGFQDVEQCQRSAMRTVRRVLAELAPATQHPAAEVECIVEVTEAPVTKRAEAVGAHAAEPPPLCHVEEVLAHEPPAPGRAGLRHGRVPLLRIRAPHAASTGSVRRAACRSPPHVRTKHCAPPRRRTKNRNSNDDMNKLFKLTALSLALVTSAAQADWSSAVKALSEGREGDAVQELNLLAGSTGLHRDDAVCMLGSIHLERGELETALRLFEEAAERGNRMCQYAVGRALVFGLDFPKDERRGVQLLEAAAGQGVMQALVSLGFYYFDLNDQLATLYFQRAADAGSAEAQYALGITYLHGRPGVRVDKALAAKWIGRAAESGYPDAKTTLSQMEREAPGGTNQ